MTETELRDLAEELLLDYLDDDIEFGVVYDDDRTEDLTEDDQRKVHNYMNGAKYAITMPEVAA